MSKRRFVIMITLLAMLLSLASPAVAQQARVVFNSWVLMHRLTVGAGGATIEAGGLTVTDGGVTVADDDLTVTSGAMTAGGAVTVGQDLTISKQITLTVDATGIITPTGSYQPVTAGAAMGVGAIAPGDPGDLLLLINVGSNTITISDTGTLLLSGNAALGQNDTILLISDGTNWIQITPEGDN